MTRLTGFRAASPSPHFEQVGVQLTPNSMWSAACRMPIMAVQTFLLA